MSSGASDFDPRSVCRDALPQLSRGNRGDRFPGAVDGCGDHASVGYRRALQASQLAEGMLSRGGAQT
jgi:hypothetical protein